MSTALLSLIMDIFVMAALAGTIYYTLRLSKSLNNFKSSRGELKILIDELGRNINEAQRAIDGLKKSSTVAADNLDGVLLDARKMAAEMKFINETSEGLAGRLETLAERNRKVAESFSAPASVTASAPAHSSDPDFPSRPHRSPSAAGIEAPAFFIQDREFNDADFDGAEDGDKASAGSFASQAEKDLYDALQRNKKKSPAKGHG